MHLALVLRLDLAGLSEGQVQRHTHGTARPPGQPAARGSVGLGRQADLVLAGLGGGEGEAAGVAIALGHDPVVVVEDLVDGDEDSQVGVDGIRVRLLVDDFGGEGSCAQLVLAEGYKGG